jgi:hypothetical protein
MVVQLGYPPQRIDIVTQVDGVEFGPCWDRHIEIEISGRRVPFISVDDLLANKKASGRPRTWPTSPPSRTYRTRMTSGSR